MRILNKEIVDHEGEEVQLAGWVSARRDHGKLIFIDLRDRSGLAQIVFNPKDYPEVYRLADKVRLEWVLKIRGKVVRRPKGMENPNILSGHYEVQADALEILREAQTPPFDVSSDGREINEETRMQYRYLDLRRPRMAENLKNRARVFKFIRDFLAAKDFVEVETPILSKSTPEGARDYLVPSRQQVGKFYALPQSPQQYKQLLMVAGLERYFQIAKCFRDEDTRGDRQPEFTQLDLEMSFVSEEEILALVEELFSNLVETLYPQKKIQKLPFPRIPYEEAIAKYNSDKPDLRQDQSDSDELAFAFVINFPMFEWKEQEKRWDAVHHPFTLPKIKDVADFQKKFADNPSKIAACQYDLVLNGFEIGGGSMRIHDPNLLLAVFEAMGHDPAEVREKFGHLLEAFSYGAPPHGGIALGLDRVMAILQNEPNIREVIAFPKTGDGRDLMMGAPAKVSETQLDELGLEVKKKK